MQYKKFRDIELSRLGMGNMRLPVKKTDAGEVIDYDRAKEMIDYTMKNGINYYDTAYVYHEKTSEDFLGMALKEYPRESYYLATKFHIHANPDYRAVFEEQLTKLNTDYIDFYLIHCVQDNNYETYFESGCIDYFLEQQKLGRIKYLGFSSHATPQVLKIFAEHHHWDFAQIQLNYYDWEYGTAKEEYEILTEHGIPVMVMESIRGGRLSNLSEDANKLLLSREPDRSISSWALRFLMTLPNVYVMLSGMSTLSQVQDNIKTFSEDCALSESDTELLIEACHIFRKQMIVPCTACRYCVGECPVGIDIPKVLSLYGKAKLDGIWEVMREINKLEEGKRPADCLGCGACMGECPQSIGIPEIMSDFANML